MELVDATLDPKDYKADEVKRIMEIALLCTQSTVSARPTMSEVVVLLLSKGNAGIQPTRPTFIDATSRVCGDPSTSTSLSNSNDLSFDYMIGGFEDHFNCIIFFMQKKATVIP
ncbi:Cysteine-rich receptor-like protein kinase 1 [Acorus calamus]|uniref:Cysteine-rich receptor-like protein kinase 1 n=1 Tax=Acorus calamus TaxID=4465 RepID=A0AAV9F3Q4_ACOCL|nr:Cysteine-rich receptor-like protein kinase 1 [Acorus calamus]